LNFVFWNRTKLQITHTHTTLFDFENLEVYKKSKDISKTVLLILKDKTIDTVLRDQLKRAVISIVLNIAEGSGKFSKPDKRNFYTIARGSTYESVAVLEILKEQQNISIDEFKRLYSEFEIISKMLLGLIKSQR
jgi:four helix bundle protein